MPQWRGRLPVFHCAQGGVWRVAAPSRSRSLDVGRASQAVQRLQHDPVAADLEEVAQLRRVSLRPKPSVPSVR